MIDSEGIFPENERNEKIGEITRRFPVLLDKNQPVCEWFERIQVR